jgi:hypothetical protein
MATAPDIDRLQSLTKEELLYEYAERLTRNNFRETSGAGPTEVGKD